MARLYPLYHLYALFKVSILSRHWHRYYLKTDLFHFCSNGDGSRVIE